MTLKSWADVDRLTDTLEIIADWQDDLRSRIARGTLRFELIGFDPEEQAALEAEAQEFKRVCRGLSFGRCLAKGRRHEQRRARRRNHRAGCKTQRASHQACALRQDPVWEQTDDIS